MKKAIGIIGYGNMGQAIARGIKKEYTVFIFDKDKDKSKNSSGIKAAQDNIDLIKKVDTIILAVKPQDFDSLLDEIKDDVKDKLIISIAAGINTKFLERCLGRVKVIRVMPNLPVKIGLGMICLCRGRYANKNDLNFTKQLFGKLGKTLILKEELMDASTAISGSGPGYLYDMAEGKSIKEIKRILPSFVRDLTVSAKNIGFTHRVASILAKTTAEGSIRYLELTKFSPLEAKKQVVSKGGTTEAALEVLRKDGSLTEAVKAAKKRAEELSRKG